MASIKFLQDIDIDGNVLVSQAGNAELTLLRTSGAELTLRSQSNLGTLTTSNNFPLHLGTNGGTRMAILTNGDVGVGTSSPSAKLDVYNGGTSGNIASFKSGATTSGDYAGITLHSSTVSGVDWYGSEIRSINTASSPGSLNPRLGFFTQDNNTYLPADRTEKMSILGNGNIGIGTSSASAKTHIVGSGNTSATTSLLVEDSALADLLKIGDDGSAQLGKYGSGTFTGTAAYTLAVDSSGNIIETSGGGGGTGTLQQVTDAGNTTTNSITLGSSTAGSARLNIVGADSTDANDAILIENSSADPLFKITNSGNIFIEHATRTNSIVINNEDGTGTGTYSTILGYQAGHGTNVNGTYLTALGARAAHIVNGGTYSVAVGMNAARNCQSFSNAVVVGMNAVNGSQGFTSSVAIGRSAAEQSKLIYSTVVGYYAGRAMGTTQRSNNVYIGYNVASSSNNQSGNTFIGSNIQSSSTEALNNTVIIGSYNAERLRIDSTGKFKFDSYGSGSFTGTATVNLEADSSGNVIERLEERGAFSGTTDGTTGQLTISHSLGETPSFVMLTMDDYSNQATYSSVISKTSTTVTIVNPNRGVTVSGYYIFSN